MDSPEQFPSASDLNKSSSEPLPFLFELKIFGIMDFFFFSRIYRIQKATKIISINFIPHDQ